MKYRGKMAYVWPLLVMLLVTACESSPGTATAGAEATTGVAGAENGEGASKEVVMYKSPGCECCSGWAEHLKGTGFTVVAHKREDMEAIKAQYGVPKKFASCHTALIGGYVIEGHVPAADIARLLKERPNVVGLAAPGMPAHSPGMQAKGLAPKGYNVLAFEKDGSSYEFAHY